jgi:hypothetical protein
MIGGRNNMNKTVLIIGIIFLLIGASVVSSNDNVVEDTQTKYTKYQSNEPIDVSKELLLNGKTAYGNIIVSGESGEPEGRCYFDLDDPGNITLLGLGYLGSVTWAPGNRIFSVEYVNGALWVLYLETGEMVNIGGGGTSCNVLTWDPVYNRLYGAGSGGLYEYDPETGEQEYIGPTGVSNAMVGLAINSEGVCYAWDIVYNGPSTLYTVDLETGEATEVGPLGIEMTYGTDGHFDVDTDILYLPHFTDIDSPGQLYKLDFDVGEWILVGDFEGGAIVINLAIPYTFNPPPVTTISFDPPEPDGENGWYVSNVTVTLNATDYDGVNATYYRINCGEWNNYSSPFIISEDGDDIHIEFYSVDNAGKEEDVKSAWIDIDKTPPNVTVELEVKRIGWRKWLIIITITSHENTSGMDRVEFFLNGGLQSVVSGSGPSYSWSWVMYGDMPFEIKVIIYDVAGNSAVVIVNETDVSYHNLIKDIFTQQSTYPLIIRLLERFPLLERFLNSIQRG